MPERRSCLIPTRPSASGSLGSRDVLEAMLARTMPAVLALLVDGVPRSKQAIVATLADGHGRKEVGCAVMRLAVTGRIAERRGRFVLALADEPAAG